MVNFTKLLRLMDETGTTKAHIAKAFGKQRNWLSDKIKNNSDFTDEQLRIVADMLRTTVAYLRDETDNPERNAEYLELPSENIHFVPLFESASAGFGVIPNEYPVDFYPCYIKGRAENYICIKVKGDSMQDVINDGEVILVEKTDTCDDGQIAVVIAGDEGYVKRVQFCDEGVKLVPENKKYPTMICADYKIVGRVKMIFKVC